MADYGRRDNIKLRTSVRVVVVVVVEVDVELVQVSTVVEESVVVSG